MTETSATEKLRRMLDERGVEWWDGGEGLTIIPAQDGVPRAWTVGTWPYGKDMGDCLWIENRHPLTPEQAIAATLGSGTCEDANTRFDAWTCSACRCTLLLMFDDYGEPTFNIDGVASTPNYCPNCGAKVVE